MNLKNKRQALNQIRIKYLTTKNKVLSVLVSLLIFAFIAIAIPLIALSIGILYLLLFVWASQRLKKGNINEGELKSVNEDEFNDRT